MLKTKGLCFLTLGLFLLGVLAASTTPCHAQREGASKWEEAILKAGGNAPQLKRAESSALPEHKQAVRWLIENMPVRDLQSLTAGFILTHVDWAYRARRSVPWSDSITDELFFNDVLPYACVNERRDPWRQDFCERFLPIVQNCQTPGEAAMALNSAIWDMLEVRYSTKRPKADQSPYESIEAKMASCTGLSILLIDACRSVAVPARFVGVPEWTTKQGNHSWVEVWDDHQWHCLGAAEPGPLGETWFLEDAANADPSDPIHWVYATSFAPTGLTFPCAWNPAIDYVNAVDVTQSYRQNRPEIDKRILIVQVFEKRAGPRVALPVRVLISGRICAEGLSRDDRSDTNDMLTFKLAADESYDLEITCPDRRIESRSVGLLTEARLMVEIYLDED